ncbi:MAG: flagellar export chaperone FliS [Alphaproteobacteria bacterium]|nr:MAG: flagellar export chaperone FliS [Alphaproteobacteria bacterium]
MVQKNAHKVYAQQQIYTASPAKLVYMLYDHAIGALRDAIKAIEENNIEKRWKSNTKACEIITHLWTTLDMEGGGSIAQNLDQLFGFMLTKLPEVDFKNNPQPAKDVITLLEPLRDAWKELLETKTEQELAQAAADVRTDNPALPTTEQVVTGQAASSTPAPESTAPKAPVPTTYAKSFAAPLPPKSPDGKNNQSVSVSA